MDEEAVSFSCTIKPLPVALALESTSRCLRSPQAAKSCTQPLPYLPTSPTRTQCLTLVYLFTRRCARAVVALARIFWLLSTSLSQQLISILPQSPTPRLCTCGCASHPLPNCCAHRDVVGVAECTRSLSPGRSPGCLAVVSSPLRLDVLQHQPGRDLVTLY